MGIQKWVMGHTKFNYAWVMHGIQKFLAADAVIHERVTHEIL